MTSTPSYILRLTRAAFRQEAEELLAELDTSLLQLESAPNDPTHVNRVFRVMHTLKGSGATAGFDEVSHLVHRLEDIFNGAREGRVAITSSIIDRVLPIMDLVKQMLAVDDAGLPSLVEQGARLVEGLKDVGHPTATVRAGGRAPTTCTDESEASVWELAFRPHRDFFSTGNDPLVYLREVLRHGPGIVRADTDALREAAVFAPEESYLAWTIQLASEVSERALREVFAFVEDEADIAIRKVSAEEAWVLPAQAYFEKEVLGDFLEEAGEDLVEVERLVLAIEQAGDRSTEIAELRRHLHNLKGIARMLLSGAHRQPPAHHPLRALGDLCHAAEDALVRGGASLDEDIQALLDLVDWTRDIPRKIVGGGSDAWPGELLARLCAGAPAASKGATSTGAPVPMTAEVARQYQEVCSGIMAGRAGQDVAPEGALRTLARALRTLGAAAEFEGSLALAKLVGSAVRTCEGDGPTRWAEIEGHARLIDQDLLALADERRASAGQESQASRPSLRTRARTVSLRPAPSARPKSREIPGRRSSPPAKEAASGSKVQGAELGRSIRVDQGKLDRLMQAISELLVAKNTLPVLARKVDEGNSPSTGREIKDLGVRIAHIAEDLQDAMRQVRMLPIRTVFQKFPRMIRDLARGMGKSIQLIVSGEETELDKTVLEQIGDPLVHLIRNAVDHGVELPDERREHGKPEMGSIGLEVLAEGSHIVIRVSDDGRGMDPAKLRKKALEKGLLEPARASSLSDEDSLDLVFLPGFSTAETVTDVSGRGVGMDVVHNSVRALRGSVHIASTLGSGSVFTIRIPSSVMVSKGMLVEAGGEQYVLPLEAIRGMVKLQGSEIRTLSTQSIAVVRGEVTRVVSMDELLGRTDEHEALGSAAEVNTLLVTTDSGTLGVAVDRLISELDVIAKPLAEGYDRKRVFRGATILGDGRIALVLEPARFDRLLAGEPPREVSPHAQPPAS